MVVVHRGVVVVHRGVVVVHRGVVVVHRGALGDMRSNRKQRGFVRQHGEDPQTFRNVSQHNNPSLYRSLSIEQVLSASFIKKSLCCG